MDNISEADITYICKKIFKYFEKDELLLPYIENSLIKVKNFLRKKHKTETFNRDKFAKYIIDYISNRKIKENIHVGVLAAQSIGEPVTQSALNYFHKVMGDSYVSNGLKDLYNITHNKTELSIVEFYLKPGEYDMALKSRVIKSMQYTNLNDVVLDIVYDGFNLRIYLCSHTIYNLRIHPKIIYLYIKDYLKKTNHLLDTWDSSVNLSGLYIEFVQPASKILDWLDENHIEYLVDADMLCVYKPKNINGNSDELKSYDFNANCTTNTTINNNNNDNNNNSNDSSNTNITISTNNNSNSDYNNFDDININSINEKLIKFFESNNLSFDDNESYYMLDSHYINLNHDDILKLCENIVLTGTKGVVKVIPRFDNNNEFYVEVIGTDLDPLFNNEYVDKSRSRYLVYGNTKDISFELRKQNILMQLKRIVNSDDSSSYNNQHIELLTNFMCRNNTIIPMSRFGMRNNDYSFISQLSFEDPYNVIQDVLYGVEDNLTSISSKLITGIYNNENEKIE